MNRIHNYAIVCDDVKLGKNVRIGAFSFICNNTIIKDNVFIGQNVSFCNDKYPPSHGAWKKEKPIIVEENVSIGSGSTILPSVRIGQGALIGAGSVVTKDVSAGRIVKGVPAK
jgi:acetyltransferase-like isoleucine patch superfamily enzyme